MKSRPSKSAEYAAFQQIVGRTLLVWSGLSVIFGVVAQFWHNPVARQFGLQALVWGAVDGVIALFGLRNAAKPHADVVQHAKRFRMLVAMNALLDVGYIAGGWALLQRKQADHVGTGLGIIVQGGFLLLFDLALTVLSGRWARRGKIGTAKK